MQKLQLCVLRNQTRGDTVMQTIPPAKKCRQFRLLAAMRTLKLNATIQPNCPNMHRARLPYPATPAPPQPRSRAAANALSHAFPLRMGSSPAAFLLARAALSAVFPAARTAR